MDLTFVREVADLIGFESSEVFDGHATDSFENYYKAVVVSMVGHSQAT
jgi:hypothetical protein